MTINGFLFLKMSINLGFLYLPADSRTLTDNKIRSLHGGFIYSATVNVCLAKVLWLELA